MLSPQAGVSFGFLFGKRGSSQKCQKDTTGDKGAGLSRIQTRVHIPCTFATNCTDTSTLRRADDVPRSPPTRRQRSTLYATERAVLSRVCLLFSKISNLQRLRLLGIILTSGIRYRLRSSKVVPSATRTYQARSYLAYD